MDNPVDNYILGVDNSVHNITICLFFQGIWVCISGYALGYFLLNASDFTSGVVFVSVMANPPKDFFVS